MSIDIDKAVSDSITQLSLELRKQKIEISKLDNKWKPRLSTRVSYSKDENSSAAFGSAESESTAFGVELSVPFPNFSQSDRKSDKAKFDIEMLDEKIRERSIDTRKSIERLSKKISELYSQLELASRLVEGKKAEVEASRNSFNIGKLTNIELQFIENKVDHAESKYFEKVYSLLSAIADLSWYCNKNFIQKETAIGMPVKK